MKKNNILTVCIPCYNAGEYIKQTLFSLISSSFKDFNVYIFDNASTDNSVKIIKSFIKKYKNIFLYQNKNNIGMFQNMNKCLLSTNSNYLKILCADDILYKDCLLDQVNVLNKFKDVVLVYGASNILNDKGKKILNRKFYSKNRRVNGGVLINKILLSGRNPLGEPTGIMLRSSVIRKNKLFFDEKFKYISDMDLWIKILQFGNGYYCSKINFGFRLHKNQGTYHLFRRAIDEHMMLFSKYNEEYGFSLIDYFFVYTKLLYNYLCKVIILSFIKK